MSIAKATEEGEHSVGEVAEGLRRSVDWVRRQLAMLSWPEDVLQAVHRGTLSVAAAANLAPITEDAYRGYLLECAENNGATARTTAAWLQAWEAALPPAKAIEQAAEAGVVAKPLYPQAPCLCCGDVKRADELSHVPLCFRCIQRVRHLGQS